MSLLLTEEEIVMLTDYEKPKSQRNQLQKMGIAFEVGRTGKPKVLRQVVIGRLGGSSKKKTVEVNIEALSKM